MPDWNDVRIEIDALENKGVKGAVDVVRRKYIKELFEYRQRNVIAMYSGFLQKPDTLTSITDEDTNGLMNAIHLLDRSKGLDLILHTPGGDIAATHSIVQYLRKMFNDDISAIVPQIAMSAGTIIACSCKEIYLAKHSSLGPVDPQVRGTPANMVLMEFDKATKEISNDPSRHAAWHSILSQIRPTFLTQCEMAQKWSNEFVRVQLTEVMFAGDSEAEKKAKNVVERLTRAEENYLHGKHIHISECQEMGLDIKAIEDDEQLQDLVLTIHHCYMHTMANTRCYKAIENHDGKAMFKMEPVMPVNPFSGGIMVPVPPQGP